MRLEEPKRSSRQRGTRSFAQAKNRYYPTRDEAEEELNPNSDASNRHDSFHIRGRKSNMAGSSFRKPTSRRRDLPNESDESSPESNDASREPDIINYRRRGSNYGKRESPYSRTTKETSQPSYEDESEISSDPMNLYGDDSRKKVLKEDHRDRRSAPRQNHWKPYSNRYAGASSEHSDSKSHDSSASSSSYSSSSDDDDDFQLNANCMNALFSKDAGNAANLIRCDKAGPSATEVQLKMTLPLPLQLMEGIDNLVPSKKEFESAIEHLRYNGDKFAKKCDFDYNRLDEQVIIDEEFAGEVMPQFYKSLFEAPTEVTSDEEEESSKHQQEIGAFRRKPEESAFDVNPSQFNATVRPMARDGPAESVVRPESLPSHILIGGDESFVSSEGSFELTPFGATREFDTRPVSKTVQDGFQKDTTTKPSTKMVVHSTGYAEKTQAMDAGYDSSHLGNQRGTSVQRSMRELISTGGQTKQKSQPPSATKTSESKFLLSRKLSHESVQENPSFDEGRLSKKGTLVGRQTRDAGRRQMDELRGQREKNALSKFTIKTTTPVNKEWIPAKKEQLDLVDQAYPSFEVPDDELPKRKLQSQTRVQDEAQNKIDALVDGIPNSVDYRKKSTDKEIGTVYSDLTVDEEAFGRAEYPVVQALTLSDHSDPTTAELKAKKKLTAQNKCIDPSMDIGSPSLSAGDELMGHREKVSSLGNKKDREDCGGTGLREEQTQVEEKLPHVIQTDPEEGPLDEIMGIVSQKLPRASADVATTHTGGKSSQEWADSHSNSKQGTSPNQARAESSGPDCFTSHGAHRHSIHKRETSTESREKECDGNDDGKSKSLHINSRKKDTLSTFDTNSSPPEQAINEPWSIPQVLTPVASIDRCISTDIPMDEPKDSPVASINRCMSTDIPMDEPKDSRVSLGQPSSQNIKIEESSVSVGYPTKATDCSGQSSHSRFSHHQSSPMPIKRAGNNETEKTTPQVDHEEVPFDTNSEVGHEGANISNNGSNSKDFVSRLRSAAAARLDAMNDSPAFPRGGRENTLGPAGDVDSPEEINEHELSSDKDELVDTTMNRNSLEPKDAASVGKMSISRSNQDGKDPPNTPEGEEQENDIFLDASGQSFLDDAVSDEGAKKTATEDYLDDEVSEEGTKEAATEDERFRFMSEIDDRSQGVEINYIGDRAGRINDSQSLATEPPLVTAPTTTTLETPLSTSYTMLTMDTPVGSPPEDRTWGSGSIGKTAYGSRNDFYDTEHDDDVYHFDERLAKLSALLPASKQRNKQTREVAPFNLVHLFFNGMTAIVLLVLSWLKHITGLQRERKTSSKVSKGEPNFRGYQVALDLQSTCSQRIQGSRHFQHELNHMEQEAGTFVEFIVPDVHGPKEAQEHQTIWSVNSSSQSSRKSRRIAETYSNIRQSFSRGDAKSVASMKGWSAKSDFCETEFREE
jgi:hypothetical protein